MVQTWLRQKLLQAGKGWYRLPLGGGSNGKDKYLWYATGDRGVGKKLGLKIMKY